MSEILESPFHHSMDSLIQFNKYLWSTLSGAKGTVIKRTDNSFEATELAA